MDCLVTRFLASLSIGFALCACSGGSSGSQPGGTSTPDAGIQVIPGQIRLNVESAREESSIGGLAAGPNKMFVTIRLSLANGLSGSIAAAPAVFRVRTAEGLEQLAAPQSAALSDACPAAGFLSPGHVFSCAVSFELGRDEQPVALVYTGSPPGADGGAGPGNVEAPIQTFVHCSRCDDQCVDLETDPAHCGACNSAVPQGGSCVQGKPTCSDGSSACGNVCVNLMTNPAHCGACFQASGQASCVNGTPTCAGGLTFVSGSCIDLLEDDANCGSPGHVCQGSESCNAGKCLSYESASELTTCSALCAKLGKQCVPYDDLPYFNYDCPLTGGLAFANAPCTATPKQTTPWGGETCTFYSIDCYCG